MYKVNNKNSYAFMVFASIGYLFVAIFLIYPTKTHAQTAYPQSITYKGHYTCTQGMTDLTLTFDESLDKAVFDFNYNDIAKGSFNMEVDFNDEEMILRGKDWIERPNNFITVDLKGSFDSDFEHYNGQVLAKGCSNFDLVLQGTNENRALLKTRIPTLLYLGNLERSMLDVFHPFVFYDKSEMQATIQQFFILHVAKDNYECVQKLVDEDKLVSTPKRDLEGDISLIISECGSNALPSYDEMLSDLEMEKTKKLSREYYSSKKNRIKYCSETERLANKMLSRGYGGELLNKFIEQAKQCNSSRSDFQDVEAKLRFKYNIAETSSLRKLMDNDDKELEKWDYFIDLKKMCNLKDMNCRK